MANLVNFMIDGNRELLVVVVRSHQQQQYAWGGEGGEYVRTHMG